MANQAQVDALEHMLMALLRTKSTMLTTSTVFINAEERIKGSKGPKSESKKKDALDYLELLRNK